MANMTANNVSTSRLGAIKAPGAGLLAIIGASLALIGALLYPPAAFSIDEAIYIDMAHAMATRGAFDVTPQNLPDGAPLMAKSDHLVHIIGHHAIPQYPGLYGVIAAPFYIVLGLHGLVLLNALCAVFSLWLTFKITRSLTDDPWTAHAAVLMLGAASIFGGYVFAIWPHMTALAFVLGGAFFTLRAGSEMGSRALAYAVGAGLVFSLGVGLRIDIILAGAAAFFWLRLFAIPSDRIVTLALGAGLIPGLLLVAWINQIKFGVFNPFTYGAEKGAISIGNYTKPLIVAGALALFAFLIDVSAGPTTRALKALRQTPVSARIGAALLALGAIWLVFPHLHKGAWLMLVDIQSYNGPARPGLEKDAYGYWDFWGIPKKALLQSMPWAVLSVTPAITLFRKRNNAQAAFAMAFAAPFILFFAMRGWHGGMGYNMRYYLAATPFIAMLAAMGLAPLKPLFAQYKTLILRSTAAGIALAMGAYALSPLYGAFAVPLRLYPQLLLAASLGGAIIFAEVRPNTMRIKTIIIGLAGVAFANAAMISVFDVNGYLADRARYVSYDRAYTEMTKSDSVIFTQFDELLVGATRKGAAIIRVTDNNTSEIEKTITAYANADRCVYAHTAPAAHAIGEGLFEKMPMPTDAPAPGLALYVYRESPARCR